ncbi:MAG TPA: hypothetical protein ENJ86_00315 [Methylothermaceae bacterium]|nr:hypothetical protein [Methylothermaceae bacterium]
MRFYTQTHQHVCGVDLHTKTLYLCILNHAGEIVLHSNLLAKPKPFHKAIKLFRGDLVVGAECMFSWYWLADLCLREEIKFILGHALSKKAIHGGIPGAHPSGSLLSKFDPVKFVCAGTA